MVCNMGQHLPGGKYDQVKDNLNKEEKNFDAEEEK